MTDQINITQSADERQKALMTAWEWGFDAAMDYRDRTAQWAREDGIPGNRPKPQLNPWKVES